MYISKIFIRPINIGCTLDGNMALELRFDGNALNIPIKELAEKLTKELKQLNIPFNLVLLDVRYLSVIDILSFQILSGYLTSQNFKVILHTSYRIQFSWTEHFPYYCVVEDDPETPVKYMANEKIYSFQVIKDFLSTFVLDKKCLTTLICSYDQDMKFIYPYLQKVQGLVRVINSDTLGTFSDENSLEIVL